MAHPTHGEHDLNKLGWQWYVKLGPTVSLGVMNWTMLNIHYLMMLLNKLTNHGSAILRRFLFIFLLYFNVKLWMTIIAHFFVNLHYRFVSLHKSLIFSGQAVFEIVVHPIFTFLIISHWKKRWPFIWTNCNSLHLMILCTKFVWKLALWF